ncbi:MAG: class I SAM-dependent methyltransferase [Candidatus Pacearchaeota archaeon]|nr:class I SAM-dependent methyltransferase [Candidatus Pacearchaeota archaeon]
MKKTLYTDEFYDARVDSLESAKVIVPLILKYIKPKNVVDVGCGTGAFLSVFRKKGVKKILGIDGKWVNKEKLLIPQKDFHVADLEKPLNIHDKFDLVISVEVAEHLPEKYAETYINSLTKLGPVILFSAAIPYQHGPHHVNKQWPKYWVSLFKKKGFVPVDCIRKEIWEHEGVAFWYTQNILLFVKKDYLKKNRKLKKEAEQTNESFLALVHPKMYLIKAKRKK